MFRTLDVKRLADLTMQDCGRNITITHIPQRSLTTISGPLGHVEQNIEWVDISSIGDPEPRYSAGRRTTEIRVGPFTAELSADTECILS